MEEILHHLECIKPYHINWLQRWIQNACSLPQHPSAYVLLRHPPPPWRSFKISLWGEDSRSYNEPSCRFNYQPRGKWWKGKRFNPGVLKMFIYIYTYICFLLHYYYIMYICFHMSFLKTCSNQNHLNLYLPHDTPGLPPSHPSAPSSAVRVEQSH